MVLNKSLFRALAFGVPALLVLVFLERCTTIDVTYPEMLRPPMLTEAPILKGAGGSEAFEVVWISDPYLSNVTYQPEGRFFITTGRQIRKFDQTGQQVFSFEHTGESQNPPFSHYILTPEGVYDLSRDIPVLEPIVQTVNGDENRAFTQAGWEQTFAQGYADAEIVIHVNPTLDYVRPASFLRINGDWVIAHTAHENVKITTDWELGTTFEGFPQKHNRTVLLKDVAEGHYSSDSDRVRDGSVGLAEDQLQYPAQGQLTMLGFDKARLETAAYIPIPVSIRGPAYYKLRIGEDDLIFREMGVQHVISKGGFSSNLSWFTLPEPYAADIPVSFLEFRPGNNMDTMGSDGLYVIRPR